MPILFYGCEIWGYCDITQIEVLYRNYLRKIMRLSKRTASCIVYGETGTLPLSIYVDQSMVNFWLRLVQGQKSKFSYSLYHLMKFYFDKSILRSKWIEKIKNILDYNGFSFVWNNPTSVNPTWLKGALRQKLKDITIQTWTSEVNSNSLCINYKILMNVNSSKKLNKLCKFISIILSQLHWLIKTSQ